MNKSEVELQNVTDIMNAMPAAEKALCTAMISSLMASVGNPIHGRTFMIAVAYTNCQVAVHNIKMGLVNEDGSIPEKFMKGDGRAFGGVKAEVIAVDECEQTLDEALEARAKEIYEGWLTKNGFIKWVDRGNSIMQNEARAQARKEFNETTFN